MVEGVGLENRRVVSYLAGSNPVPFRRGCSSIG